MSHDFPFYEELCRRKHRAAIWWRIGDVLYYLGLFTAIISSSAAFALGIKSMLLGEGSWAGLIVGLPVGILIHLLGRRMKQHSYRVAARDGIHVEDY